VRILGEIESAGYSVGVKQHDAEVIVSLSDSDGGFPIFSNLYIYFLLTYLYVY